MVRRLGFALTLVGLLLVGMVALHARPFSAGAAPRTPTPTRAVPTPAPTSTAAPSATPSSRPTMAATPVPTNGLTKIATWAPTKTPLPTAVVPFGGAAGGTPSVQIAPAVVQLQPGQTLDLQVRVDDPNVTRGAQFGLSFDPALLELTEVAPGTYYHDWARAHGASTIAIPDVQIDAQRGKVTPFAIAILGGPWGGPTGPGLLATIHGRAKAGATGRTLVTLNEVVLAGIRMDGTGTGPDVYSASEVSVSNAIVVVGSGSAPLPAAPTPLLVRQMPVGQAAGGAAPIAVTPAPTSTPAPAR